MRRAGRLCVRARRARSEPPGPCLRGASSPLPDGALSASLHDDSPCRAKPDGLLDPGDQLAPRVLLPHDDQTILVVLIEDLRRHARTLTGADTRVPVDEHSYPHVTAHRLALFTTLRATPEHHRSCSRA